MTQLGNVIRARRDGSLWIGGEDDEEKGKRRWKRGGRGQGEEAECPPPTLVPGKGLSLTRLCPQSRRWHPTSKVTLSCSIAAIHRSRSRKVFNSSLLNLYAMNLTIKPPPWAACSEHPKRPKHQRGPRVRRIINLSLCCQNFVRITRLSRSPEASEQSHGQ